MDTTTTLSPDAQAIAEAQAEKDRQFMEDLKARAELAALVADGSEKQAVERRRISHAERVRSAQNEAIVAALQQVPLNRAQRRAQVKAFAAMLRQVSV